MSDSQEDDDVKVEIQKLLKQINYDMGKLKNELSSMNNLIEENASLPMTAKLVNEKLMMAAKKAGIDLESIGDITSVDDSEEDQAQGGEDTEQSSDEPLPSTSNATAISAATDQLTERMKYALK